MASAPFFQQNGVLSRIHMAVQNHLYALCLEMVQLGRSQWCVVQITRLSSMQFLVWAATQNTQCFSWVFARVEVWFSVLVPAITRDTLKLDYHLICHVTCQEHVYLWGVCKAVRVSVPVLVCTVESRSIVFQGSDCWISFSHMEPLFKHSLLLQQTQNLT
jgi:hypothetical protein